MPKLYFEDVIERGPNNTIIQSKIRLASQKEIEKAKLLHKQGKCPHNIVFDREGWLYDFRICYTCGIGLGAI